MSLTRGMTKYHLWLAVIFGNRHGKRFNGCTATMILYQLMCNLLLFNLVPAVIPDHVTQGDLIYYAMPFNMVAFIIAAIMEVRRIWYYFRHKKIVLMSWVWCVVGKFMLRPKLFFRFLCWGVVFFYSGIWQSYLTDLLSMRLVWAGNYVRSSFPQVAQHD